MTYSRKRCFDPLGRQWAFPLICLCLAVAPALAFEYGLELNPELQLDAAGAGASPAHHLSFKVRAGELETYRARLSYPDAFRFNGFDALGPANTPVGAYQLDLNFDGSPDVTVVLRSLNRHTAYADVLADQRFSADLEPTLAHAGAAEFLLSLPFGGDADTDTRVAPFSAQVTLSLFQGLLTSPAVGGDYTVKARFTSVDPDTDGFNDGANDEPVTLGLELPVQIDGSADLDGRFAALHIKNTRARLRHDARDHFEVRGRYRLGATSDGIDVPNEDVTVILAGFGQRLPGSAFSRHGGAWHFKSQAPGIRKIKLRADGHFEIDARHVELGAIDPNQPVFFSLHIGDDFGETTLWLDCDSHFHP